MVTIIDVANVAGVAPSTVSYVLTGKRSISPSTRRLVENAIRELGYQRRGARPPARRRTGVLAMVSSPLPADDAGTAMKIVAAASAAARAHGMDLLLVADEHGTAAMHRVVSGANADAVIVGDVEPGDPRLPVLLSSSLPAVVLGSFAAAPGLGCVMADHAAGARACAAHLAGLGHRSIVHLDRAEGSLGSRAFRQAFVEAAADKAMNVVARTWAPGGLQRCLDEAFARDRSTALVVQHATPLAQVLSALDERGMRIPHDVSVVAVGPDTVAHHGIPLSTVSVAPRELGAAAVASAVRLLADPAAADTRRLAARFVPGGSTIAPASHPSDPPISRAG